MDINLEKIELVKDRTGSTYAEAKEALEKADGSVVDAIIDLEEKLNEEYTAVNGASLKDSPVFAKMKEIVEKGNVTRIIISKNEKTIVNFPLTAGVIGAVLVPWGAILGIVAALGAQCDIDFVGQDGEVVDINGKVVGAYDKAKGAVLKGVDFLGKAGKDAKVEEKLEKVEDFAMKASDKVQEWTDKGSAKVTEAWDKIEGSETFEDIKAAFDKGTAKLVELWESLEKSGKLEEVRDSIEKVAMKASEAAKKAADDFRTDAEEAAEEEFKDEEL